MNKILVLDNHGLGDVMMTLPAIRWLLRESKDEIWMAIKNHQFKELLLGEGCGNNFIFLDRFTQTKFQFAKAMLTTTHYG